MQSFSPANCLITFHDFIPFPATFVPYEKPYCTRLGVPKDAQMLLHRQLLMYIIRGRRKRITCTIICLYNSISPLFCAMTTCI